MVPQVAAGGAASWTVSTTDTERSAAGGSGGNGHEGPEPNRLRCALRVEDGVAGAMLIFLKSCSCS